MGGRRLPPISKTLTSPVIKLFIYLFLKKIHVWIGPLTVAKIQLRISELFGIF